jgi:hypothetical protein
MTSTNPTSDSSPSRPENDRDPAAVADRELERQGHRMGHSAGRFVLVGIVIAIPGIALLLIDHGWSIGVGIAVLLIASIPLVVGVGLLVSGAVSRWAARRKLFA